MSQRWIWVTIVMLMSLFGGTIQAQEEPLTLLTEQGSYGVGLALMTLVDASRDNREIEVQVLYPADKSNATPVLRGSLLLRDAPADRSEAPYPLLIYSHGSPGNYSQVNDLLIPLASQGYVVIAPQHPNASSLYGELVGRPLDMLFLMDQFAIISEGDLEGMIDSERVGLIGYSMGGSASLELVNLVPDIIRKGVVESLPEATSDPLKDERIQAVLAMAPCFLGFASEEMMVDVDTPLLLMHGTRDASCDYRANSVYLFEHLTPEDHYLFTLVDQTHQVFTARQEIPLHFAVAFFGKYLQGNEAYTSYLVPEGSLKIRYVDVVAGVYEDE